MKYRVLTCVIVAGAPLACLAVPISITDLVVPYFQNFDTLASSGSGHTLLPTGWVIHESGANADGKYTAGTGSSNVGDTYSFGGSGSTERALGGLRSANLIPMFGAQFRNDTGQVITAFTLSYWGEQWRLGAAGRQDWLWFAYSLDATSLEDGSWVRVPELDFGSPSTTGSVGARNGNDPTYRTYLSHTIEGLQIAPGQTWWIRWADYDAPGADDGLAVDDLVMTFRGAGPPRVLSDSGVTLVLLALGLLGVRGLRTVQRRG